MKQLPITSITTGSLLLNLSNLHQGRYRYTEDLLALEHAAGPIPVTGHTLEVATPLNATAWRQELPSYRDQAFAAVLLRGISEGFRIGVPDKFTHSPAPRNLQSAYAHKAIVQDWEILLGRMQHLLPSEELSLIPLGLQISPFGVIPKRNRPDKWRLIANLSAPYGHSANDAIDSDLRSISYTSSDNAALFIRLLFSSATLHQLLPSVCNR